ncbi:PIN domain-containing protein [Flammula alnicola]|nr:PIN domain-containing protein [Flammula alnicola]
MLATTNDYFNIHSSYPLVPFAAGISNPGRVAAPGTKHTYLHETLLQIDHLANEDVEMQAPLSEYAIFLVLDTNILLHHFEVLAQFVDDVETLSLPVIVIVPGAVVYELDGCTEESNGLAWFARRATAWLLEKIRERRSVKGQAQEETCKSTRNWKIREPGEMSTSDMFNDNLILDCCLYFSRGRPTFLCSADNNLCITSQAQGIPTITPSRYGSSREMAQSIYGDKVELGRFKGYRERYRTARDSQPTAVVDDDDKMSVDDEGSVPSGEWKSEHPVNMLHEAVIDHFSRLLMELVGKVGGDEVRQRSTAQEEANLSQHAPRRRHYTEWSVSDCLEFLIRKAPAPVKMANPRPEVFLLKAYTRGVPGSRTGREWSRKDWMVGLNNLREISLAWKDVSIQESLVFLEPHIDYVFSLPLRAT